MAMQLHELKSLLRAHPDSTQHVILPDGDPIAAHFHITEVGHVAKPFIDCGAQCTTHRKPVSSKLT